MLCKTLSQAHALCMMQNHASRINSILVMQIYIFFSCVLSQLCNSLSMRNTTKGLFTNIGSCYHGDMQGKVNTKLSPKTSSWHRFSQGGHCFSPLYSRPTGLYGLQRTADSRITDNFSFFSRCKSRKE